MEHRYLTSLYLTFTIYCNYRTSIILDCICCVPRDFLVLGTILGYLSNNIDTISWVYYIYNPLNWLQVISRHFSNSVRMIGLLEDMLESLSNTSSESWRSDILHDWSGRNVNCNPVIIFRCCMAVQLQPEATSYSSVRQGWNPRGLSSTSRTPRGQKSLALASNIVSSNPSLVWDKYMWWWAVTNDDCA